ncbi:MAG: hypothetical protein ACYC61_02470 [Isosphaeraceae bacterium]
MRETRDQTRVSGFFWPSPRFWTVIAVTLLWLTVALGYDWRAFPGKPTGDRAVAEIERLGAVGNRWDGSGMVVFLTGPEVTDVTLDLVGQVDDVSELSLITTRVTDEGLERLGRIPDLRVLFIDGMDLTDRGLAHIAGLRKLEELTLWNTRITAAGLRTLAALPSLDTLILDGPLVSSEDLKALKHLRPRLMTNADLPPRKCGFGADDRAAELEKRRISRQGLTGRLRLAWRHFLR